MNQRVLEHFRAGTLNFGSDGRAVLTVRMADGSERRAVGTNAAGETEFDWEALEAGARCNVPPLAVWCNWLLAARQVGGAG